MAVFSWYFPTGHVSEEVFGKPIFQYKENCIFQYKEKTE